MKVGTICFQISKLMVVNRMAWLVVVKTTVPASSSHRRKAAASLPSVIMSTYHRNRSFNPGTISLTLSQREISPCSYRFVCALHAGRQCLTSKQFRKVYLNNIDTGDTFLLRRTICYNQKY